MNALAHPQYALAGQTDEFSADAPTLEAFDRVPAGCDVVPLCGMVAIFHPSWHEVREGSYYVTESQLPAGGMGWETYDQFNAKVGAGEPRVRIKTARSVVRATRRPQADDAWWFVMESGFRDGPVANWAAGYNIIGEVIGIYRPRAT